MGLPWRSPTRTELALPEPIAAPAASARFERVFGPESLSVADPEAAPGGTFRLRLRVAGGARLWIDEALLIDDWYTEAVDVTLERFLPATWGQRVVLEVRAAPVAGAASLELEPLAPGHRIYAPIAHGLGRVADSPPPPPTPTPAPGYPGP